MVHSITFVKGEVIPRYDETDRRVHFTDKVNGEYPNERRTDVDWGLVPSNASFVQAPEPKEYILEVDGIDNDGIDYSDAVTGRTLYKSRQGEWKFYRQALRNWSVGLPEIVNWLQGKKVSVITDDDPSYYYVGRITVSLESNEYWATVTMKYKLEAYKKYVYPSYQLDIAGRDPVTLTPFDKKIYPVVWDLIDFEDAHYETSVVSSSGLYNGEYVLLEGKEMTEFLWNQSDMEYNDFYGARLAIIESSNMRKTVDVDAIEYYDSTQGYLPVVYVRYSGHIWKLVGMYKTRDAYYKTREKVKEYMFPGGQSILNWSIYENGTDTVYKFIMGNSVKYYLYRGNGMSPQGTVFKLESSEAKVQVNGVWYTIVAMRTDISLSSVFDYDGNTRRYKPKDVFSNSYYVSTEDEKWHKYDNGNELYAPRYPEYQLDISPYSIYDKDNWAVYTVGIRVATRKRIAIISPYPLQVPESEKPIVPKVYVSAYGEEEDPDLVEDASFVMSSDTVEFKSNKLNGYEAYQITPGNYYISKLSGTDPGVLLEWRKEKL